MTPEQQAEAVQRSLRAGYLGLSKTMLLSRGRATMVRWGDVLNRAVEGTGIPVELLALRIGHETNGNARAVSSNDERGLMQWGPWHNYGASFGVGKENAFDPEISVAGGVKFWVREDRLIRQLCMKHCGLQPEGWDRWALLWVSLSNGRGMLDSFIRAMKPTAQPILTNAMHSMVTPEGAAEMFRLAEAGRFGLRAYHPNWGKVVDTVSRRTARALAAVEAAAALGGDMSYGTSFLVGGVIAALVLFAVSYAPTVLGG